MKQMATFSVGALWLGIEVGQVREVIATQEMTPIPLARGGAAGLINLRGEVVTAMDLRERLGLPAREPVDEDEGAMNVVVNIDGESVSLLVDTIGDVAEVSDTEFEEPPLTMPAASRAFVHGAFKQPEGLLLSLDVEGVVAVAPTVELR